MSGRGSGKERREHAGFEARGDERGDPQKMEKAKKQTVPQSLQKRDS